MIDYRKELATMLRDLRNRGIENYKIRRPSHDESVKCSNGQDTEAMFIRYREVTVSDLKKFLDLLPDDAYVEAEQYVDWDGYSCDDIVISAIRTVTFSDKDYYDVIENIYNSVQDAYVSITVNGKMYNVTRAKVEELISSSM